MDLIDIDGTKKHLQDARALVNTTYDTPRGAKKQYDQWLKQIEELHNLFSTEMAGQQHVHVLNQIRAQLVTWAQASLQTQDLMNGVVFCSLPILAQRGLIETLNCLYKVLQQLMAEDKCREALDLLVRV